MKVTIKRTDPDREEVFALPDACRGGTVMDVLDYISLHLDPTLGYYRHSICNQGVCGRCVLKVNGKAALACARRVQEDELFLEPRNGRVVRDLIVAP